MILFATLAACAALCAVICGWIFAPLPRVRLFYAASFLCALAALGLYLLLGRPDLPAAPAQVTSESAQAMRQEAELMAALARAPDDAEAMIKLAALRILQARDNAETARLLDRADTILPGDRRVQFMKSMLENHNPE